MNRDVAVEPIPALAAKIACLDEIGERRARREIWVRELLVQSAQDCGRDVKTHDVKQTKGADRIATSVFHYRVDLLGGHVAALKRADPPPCARDGRSGRAQRTANKRTANGR
jgi:hypothetical protein